MMDVSSVDSHLHLWDPRFLEYPWLRDDPGLNRPFLPMDVPAGTAGPNGVISVQADCRDDQGLAEVDWVAGFGRDWPTLKAIVAFPTTEWGEDVDLQKLSKRPLVKGVRRLFQDREHAFVPAESTVSGARKVAAAGLTFDAGVRYTQLRELEEEFPPSYRNLPSSITWASPLFAR